MDNPFTITVFDRDYRRQGWIGDPVAATFTVRFNAQDTGEIRLKPTDPALDWIIKPGARCRVEYLGEVLLSGRLRNPQGPFNASRTGDIVVQVQGDWRRLSGTLAWVRPGKDLEPDSLNPADDNPGQVWVPGENAIKYATTLGQEGYLRWPDGSAAYGGELVAYAETAIKKLIYDNNVWRLNQPIEILPDLGRGGNARDAGMLPAVRFGTVEEYVLQLLNWSGLGLWIRQPLDDDLPYLETDVWQPTVWPQVLTPESGVIREGSWQLVDPEVTRVVAGGPGEGPARAFAGLAAGDEQGTVDLEALYGDVLEVFKDATGAPLEWPDGLAEELRVPKFVSLRSDIPAKTKAAFDSFLYDVVLAGLAEGVPTSGVSVELAETGSFHFGGPDGFHLGDTMNLKSGPLEFSDRILECTLSIGKEGLTVTPTVGEKKDNPDRQLARMVRRLAVAQRRISASR